MLFMHHSAFVIQDGVQDRSQQILHTCGGGTLPVDNMVDL